MTADAFPGLGWGILGTGSIAALQTQDLVANGFRVAAVGSRTMGAGRAFAERFDIAVVHDTYLGLVEDPGVDVVYIAVPPPQHFENARLAMAAGKHVLLEKPFTMTGDEAQQLAALAAASRVLLMEAMWTRFLPHMIRIREILAAGLIGEPRVLIADVGQRLPTDPEFRLNKLASGGGSVLDIGIYPVSFSSQLFGDPSSICATGTLAPTGVDLQTSVVLRFDSGAQALGHSAIDVHGPNRATVVGTLGRIEIGPVWYARAEFERYDTTNTVVERFDNAVSPRGMQYQAREVERLVQEGRCSSDIMPIDESVRIMRTMDEIRSQIGVHFPATER